MTEQDGTLSYDREHLETFLALLDDDPDANKQRIAFGERAGQKVRRIGSEFGYEGGRPELKGPCCAGVNGFSLHANTDIPAHRSDQAAVYFAYGRIKCRLNVLSSGRCSISYGAGGALRGY